MTKINSRKEKLYKHLKQVVWATLPIIFLPPPAFASDPAEVVSTERGKEGLNQALKIARGKPALSI